ncbi:MAG: Hsp70 family protein [Chloroflexota bacterium]
MQEPKYIVGIDLGTTHCVVAYTLSDLPDGQEPEVKLLEIPQIIAPGEVQAQPLLPSFLLLPGPHDVPPDSLSLPWNAEMEFVVGTFARSRGAELPNRLIASAKSWLCHRGVDRNAEILPWEAPKDAQRLSPVEATSRYLSHIRQAWNQVMAADDLDSRLEQQEIYLTVPASFDAVARELTVQAAQMAGFNQLILLEEPQAAFYSWLQAEGGKWRERINVGESVLVCDVGGGTSDFSIIEVTEEEGNLELRRAAVGDHILLGGDNMDLTLAYAVRGTLAQAGTQLDNWQFQGLWHSCRSAKEQLMNDPTLETVPITILGRGSSLLGSTISTELTRSQVESVLLQGFFPIGDASEYPESKPQVGLREMGLPYAADAAITRHLAQFLGTQTTQNEEDEKPAFPAAVLFNGGVMKADPLRHQIMEALGKWRGDEHVRELDSVDLDRSVAMGAAYYGLVRQGKGIRIRAGTSRTYYIGIESSMPAVPGIPTPIKALCVVPFGMEEGTEAEILTKEFGLIVGETAVFPLLATTTRNSDKVGQEVEDWSGEIEKITEMETLLPATDTDEGGTVIPVLLQSRVTEIGTLELWCISRDDNRQWKLEFAIREEE